MHRIAEIEICNYRSCQKTQFKLEPFTPLVGYNNAGKSNILKCLDALVRGKAQTSSNHGFLLDGRNPTKGNNFKASDIFELLAREDDAKKHIKKIQQYFKDKSIWVWSLGAIEPHLCLEAKETGEWYKFKQKLLDNPLNDVVQDNSYIREFVEWCMS